MPVTDDFLQRWPASLSRFIERAATTPRTAVRVSGHYDRQWDPPQSASIEISAEPSDTFSVSTELSKDVENSIGFSDMLDQAVFGLIDILATAQQLPVLKTKIRVVGMTLGAFSTPYAFRMAGRDAARRVLEAATNTARDIR